MSRARLLPVYEGEAGALQLALQMNWARCLQRQAQPLDGSRRANIAVALAEAARARTATANSDRIAGTAPEQMAQGPLVKALFLRAKCHIEHKDWKRAESDLVAAGELDEGNKEVAALLGKLPKLKEKQHRANKKLSKEMSKWVAGQQEAIDGGLAQSGGGAAHQ